MHETWIMLSVVLSTLTERRLQSFTWNVFLAPALSCSSRETSLRKCVVEMWMNTGREVSKPNALRFGQPDSCLLTTTECDFFSRAFSIQEFLGWWFFQVVVHFTTAFTCNATKRNCKAIGEFSARMTGTSSLGGFAIESLWYKTTTIHSSPIMNYLVAVMMIRMWWEQCAWKKQQCLKKLLYGFILLPMRGGWKIGISLGGELGSSSVCKIHIKCRSGLQLCITAVRKVSCSMGSVDFTALETPLQDSNTNNLS